MERSKRKVEHIEYALATAEANRNAWDDLSFVPNSLPNICYGNTKVEADIPPFRLSSPFLINAMTGGAAAVTEINRLLAIVAREKGLAMAVGSQMAALRDPAVVESYAVVRRENPDGIVFANLGAEATVEEAQRAVEMIRADGLQIHLNVMQELLMPEGDRDFTGYLERIRAIREALGVPVIVKEVGFGMSRRTIEQLASAGVSIIDVGGRGGTNFAKVENQRHSAPLTMFESWGLSAPESLLEADNCRLDGVRLIATGGIRHGLDAAKALALGASAVGVAGALLRLVANVPLEACLAAVDAWHHQLRVAMTALGVSELIELQRVPVLITGVTAERARLRGCKPERYARRDEEPF
jgi:isopentenyl-diphosphate Delta-isomerase